MSGDELPFGNKISQMHPEPSLPDTNTARIHPKTNSDPDITTARMLPEPSCSETNTAQIRLETNTIRTCPEKYSHLNMTGDKQRLDMFRDEHRPDTSGDEHRPDRSGD